jgi:predicted transcriptional regulator
MEESNMQIKEIQEILSATLHCCENRLKDTVEHACSSDMMSDVLAFAKDGGLLISGLNNPQVVRTAEMMDIVCIVFVRGKAPFPEVVELAKQKNIVILSTPHKMYSSCGMLYSAGLKGECED